MNLLRFKYLKYVVLGLILVFVVICWFCKEKFKGYLWDYVEIKESGIFYVVIEYNFISFYVDGDMVLGFYYELIEVFVCDKGLQVQVFLVMSFN